MASDLFHSGWQARHVQIGEVRLHLVEAGREDAPAVILLHGFPEFWWGWRHQIDPLVSAGYRVIAPDMRGYNLSDRPKGVGAYRADRVADDIAALAGALGLRTFALVGHDWGGLIAWRVAARHPARIVKLVILDAPHPDAVATFIMWHPTQALRSAYIGWFQLPLVPEVVLRLNDFAPLKSAMRNSAKRGVFDEDVLERYAEAWRHPGAFTSMLNYYRALRYPGAGAVGRIAVPTMVLWGAGDQALDSRLAAASAAMADTAEVVVIEDATHWLHLEQPERIARELCEFLGNAA